MSNELITFDGIPSVDKSLKLMADFSDQLPYATSVAMNNTLLEMQKGEINNIREKFTVRKNWLRAGKGIGVTIKFTKKDKLEGALYTKAPFLIGHEEGEIRTAKNKARAIPQRDNLKVAINKLIPDSKKPNALVGTKSLEDKLGKLKRTTLRRVRTFEATMPSGQSGIWQRLTNSRLPIRLLYAYKKTAKIRKVLSFIPIGMGVFQKQYKRIFGEALAKAIATRKIN
jgi:hypothetical protein